MTTSFTPTTWAPRRATPARTSIPCTTDNQPYERQRTVRFSTATIQAVETPTWSTLPPPFTFPANSCHPGPREFPAAYSLAIPRIATPADGHRGPMRRLKTVRRPPIYPNGAQPSAPVAPSPTLPLSSRRPSVSFGGFGLRNPAATTVRLGPKSLRIGVEDEVTNRRIIGILGEALA